MEDYFAETTIRIEPEDGGQPTTLIMRPLKVKEIPSLLRLEAVADRDAAGGDLSSFADFIELVDGTVDGDVKALHRDALDGIIKTFDDLNFPEGVKRKPGDAKKFEEKEFARMVEYLIAQGHAFSEIEEYTLPRFRLFVELAGERLSGKPRKKVDPLEALKGLGIPVRG